MLAVPGIENCRGIGISTTVDMFSIPSCQNIRGVCIASSIDMNICHSVISKS